MATEMIDRTKLPRHIDAVPAFGPTPAAAVGDISRQLKALYDVLGIWWCDSCESFHPTEGEGWQQKATANPDSPASPLYYPPVV